MEIEFEYDASGINDQFLVLLIVHLFPTKTTNKKNTVHGIESQL